MEFCGFFVFFFCFYFLTCYYHRPTIVFNPVSCHSQIFLFNTPSVKLNQHMYADGIVECQKKFNSQGRHPQGIRKSIH